MDEVILRHKEEVAVARALVDFGIERDCTDHIVVN